MPERLLKILIAATAFNLATALLPAQAQQGAAVLFQNVRIFDGKSDTLSAPSNVLVSGNKIETHLDRADRGRRRATRSSSTAAGAR